MIVIEGRVGDQPMLIVGLDFQNLDRLRAGAPASSDVTGTLVALHAAPTLRDVVEELVGEGILPSVALEQFEDPQRDEARVWSADDPRNVRSVRGRPGDAGRPTGGAASRRRERLREAILDVVAPRRPEAGGERVPVFEWTTETVTVTDGELAELVDDLADAVERVPS